MRHCVHCRDRMLHVINSDLHTAYDAIDRVRANLHELMGEYDAVDSEFPEVLKACAIVAVLREKVGKWEA